MPSYYIYLISSLPELAFGVKPAVTRDNFLKACQGLVPSGEIEILRNLSLEGKGMPAARGDSVLDKWQDFDRNLRNELVKIRAAKKRADPAKYIQGGGYAGPYISQTAVNACRSPSLVEGERILDQARWGFLNELSFGHYFDFDFLIIYALKILLLERWERVNSADKPNTLQETLK